MDDTKLMWEKTIVVKKVAFAELRGGGGGLPHASEKSTGKGEGRVSSTRKGRKALT